MTFKDTHRIHEIKMLQDSIRQKWRDIKSSSIQTQRSLEVQYKPLIDPLKQLTETVVAAKEIKQEPKEENEGEVEEEEEAVFEPEQSFGRPSLASEFDAFIRANNIGDLLGTYLQFIQTDDREEADFTYGIHYDGNEWKMGSYPVSFSDNDIIINGVEYKGTPGLFELIFKKHPQSGSFNDNDLKVYKQMLEATGVHKREDGKGIKSNRGYKYTNIISNMFPPKNKKKPPLLRASPASIKRS